MQDSSINSSAALIAIDWGSFNFRAYLLDAEGNILFSVDNPSGVRSIVDGQFREVLDAQIGDWLAQYPHLPVIAVGMIGSREGWREAPYVPTPAGPIDLAHAAVRCDDLLGRRFAILPGVSHTSQSSWPDIVRGESIQLLGALESIGTREGLFILPGAHCKWFKVKEGRIQAFRTYMTGELFEALKMHSIIGKLFPETPEITLAGFTQGLANAQFQHETLSHMIFSTRAKGLFGQIPEVDLPGHLSGLLIGDEIASGLEWFGPGKITLIGSSKMTRLYRHALAGFGNSTAVAPLDVAALGLHLIGKEMCW